MIFCSLYSGSSGNSIFVSSGKTKVLIDAGLSGIKITNALKEIGEDIKELDAIFVTHEHSDHIKGIGILSRKYNIPIYANSLTWQAMANSIGSVKEQNVKVVNSNCVTINDLDIINYKTPHDAVSACGYTICSGNKKASIATDLGYFADEVRNAISDSDIVLLESNHDIEMLKFGPYPYELKRRILSKTGHLSNDDCGRAIIDIMNEKKKHIVLGHLSKINNYPDLAYQTVINILKEETIIPDKDIVVSLAKRDNPSCYIEI